MCCLTGDARNNKVVVSAIPPPLFIVAAADDLTCLVLVGCCRIVANFQRRIAPRIRRFGVVRTEAAQVRRHLRGGGFSIAFLECFFNL